MIPTGRAKLAGVLGWPVGHSRSPRLHGFWLDRLNIDGAYVPLAVAPENLGQAVAALPKLGFVGANVTVPHKETIIPFLDRIDPLAARIGAVNTLVIDESGQIEGRNTDAFGFLENLRRNAPSWSADSGPAIVLGAGGAARAVVVALVDAGVSDICLVNRSRQRAEKLAAAFKGPIRTADWEDRAKVLGDAALLVNTTVLGMTGAPILDLDLSRLPPRAVVNDVVYVPLETNLLSVARARGNPVVDGLGMLLWQAVPGFERWFGIRPEVTAELRDAVLS